MLDSRRTPRNLPLHFIACAGILLATWAPSAGAARASLPPMSQTQDIVGDFRTLAQQRPWRCETGRAVPVPLTGWTATPPACAWQNRLRMYTWSGSGMPLGSTCISAQAAWWNWTRAKVVVPAWEAGWMSHSMRDDSGPEKRIVVIRKLAQGDWSVTEWRWLPSLRAATRTWQQDRWDALAARAQQYKQSVTAKGTREVRMLQQVLDANLGHRPAERNGDEIKWQSDGLCLQVDLTAPGAQQLQLPYSADDSRLEQRAAMQLQLTRRFPNANWLSTFNLVPNARYTRGGAKFYAIWLDGATMKGQLWMPTKGDGPLVRLRIATELPNIPGDVTDNPAVTLRRQVIERELMAVAARWAFAYE